MKDWNGTRTSKHEHMVLAALLALGTVTCANPVEDTSMERATLALTSTSYEAETLARTASAAGSKVTTETGSSAGQYVQTNGTAAIGDWIQFTLPNVAAGTYDLGMLYKSNTNRAIVQASLDGVNQGPACDQYAATPAFQVSCGLGTATLSSGNHVIRFTVVGRRSSSTSYLEVIDQISLTVPGGGGGGASGGGGGAGGVGGTAGAGGVGSGGTAGAGGSGGTAGASGSGGAAGSGGGAIGVPTAYEAESLTRTASAAGSKVTTETGASANAYVQFNSSAPAVGDWIELTLPNVTAGTYNVTMLYKSNTNRAIVQASIDGVNQGLACDQYAATSSFQVPCSLGAATLSAGNHKIRFTVTGKSASSTAYLMIVDQISLMPTGVPVGCATVSVNSSGAYSVAFQSPAWTFSGNLGVAASAIATATGSDAVGSYCETAFTYTASGTRNARIRTYAGTPVVVFTETNPAQVTNTRNFPKLTTIPGVPYHITYQGDIVQYSFNDLTPDSPFVYFDKTGSTFILSGASHFPNTQTATSGAGIVTGIQADITTLPAGFQVSTMLVADTSFNRAYETWGQALLARGGKTPVANDATAVLGKFGYWTDNGATYYYQTQSGSDYRTTLINVKNYFQQNGVPLGYLQLDSWWYPKGPNQIWSDTNGGFYRYQADPTLFPNGLAVFQQSLGVPLVTHNRWLDASSPYRTQYQVSGNTVIDPAFWADRANYLKSSGVITYEQDWLSRNGLPNQSNLNDQEAYLDNMAAAMASAGLEIEYCMAVGRHIMQSTKYAAVTHSRVSADRFDAGKWRQFFYGARLVWGARLWPWTDVFKSGERDNLLLSNLSAGPVGGSDAINAANFTNIKKTIRPDSVIVKPDVPVLLLDRSVIDHAAGRTSSASIATTYTQHQGGRFTYVFGFTDVSSATASFIPSELGYGGQVYVYDIINDSGKVMSATQATSMTLAKSVVASTTTSYRSAYNVVAPIGPSGIAFLGDRNKLVPLGAKRISAFADNGTVTVAVQYAAGEGPVTLQGYAPNAPTVTALSGSVGAVTYNATTHRFTVPVTASGSSATVQISP